MKYIDLSKIDPNAPDVISWVKKANNHLAVLSKLITHEQRRDYLDKHSFWADFKPILKSIYGELCWYSDYNLEGGSFGHVDHFRPKNCSKNLNKEIILKDGYWWLAYDYTNFRLSCDYCNIKKNDYFPIDGTPAPNPNKDDDPLLLDPCNKEDWYLIDCGDDGKIIPLTSDEKNKKRVYLSNTAYGLDNFCNARKKIRNSCIMKLERFEKHYYDKKYNEFEDDFNDIKELILPDTPYSSFALKCIYRKISGKPYEYLVEKIIESVL